MRERKQHVIAKSLCPDCGYAIDRATNPVGERGPKPGDFTLCLNCAAILVFDAALRPVEPSPEDAVQAMDPSTPMGQQIETARNFIRERLAKRGALVRGGTRH